MLENKMKQPLPLPSGPSSLCFNKEDFMKPGFYVETFVVECRRRVALETLRDDLGVYLKILQSAMIELINKDYADFVNLSTNLVGMDKAINNLMSPLNQLRAEVINVRTAMDEAVLAIEDKMNRKAEIRNKKAILQRLIKIIQCVEKMESLLGISSSVTDASHIDGNDTAQQYQTRELSGQLIERVATEFNKLQFFVNKSRGLPLVEEIRPRVMNITTTLQYSLEGSFKEGLENRNTEVLRQCLRTYATIDKMRDAENLFRQHIVKPELEEIISERYIQTSPQGVSGMFTAILDFLPKHCKMLKDVTAGTGPGGGESVRGYDFLVNSVWPEVVVSIENRAHVIFAPGNPAIFRDRYQISISFVEEFERQCGSQASVKRLRTHPSYGTFMAKWSLPVYFQIRFQEIAGSFETALVTPFTAAADKTLFHHNASYTLWQCLSQCWQDDIYLQTLCHRFWKLTLQLMSRYGSWLTELYETEVNRDENKSGAPDGDIQKPDGSTELASNINNGKESSPSSAITMSQLVCLIADIQMLTVMMTDFFSENVQPRMTDLGVRDMSLFTESLQESVSTLNNQLPKFGEFIVDEISSQCLGSLKTVNDIPRLYRKTNRDIPSKASSYVTSVVKPIQAFLSRHQSVVGDDSRREWICAILQNISIQYLGITTDVLTSVQKMEQSLKRLKQKAKSSASLSTMAGSQGLVAKNMTSLSLSGQGLSDDDKIRLQLFLDVEQFGDQIDKLEISRDSVEAFNRLYLLVESAAKSSSNFMA